jgi:putative glutamine amidotransferase
MTDKPVIGIVVCGIEREKQFISSSYIHAVEHSGGIPLVIPIVETKDSMDIYLSLCNGLLFCGGIDISPVFFHEEPLPGLGETCFHVDHFQIEFMKKAMEYRIPILAICRGMQVLSVACGGSIFQDICLQPGRTLKHMQMTQDRSEGSHQVQVFPHSMLAGIIGKTVYTNSYHHQTVRRPGDGLIICAQTSDKTIEALEMADHPFCIGVQWHPECMYQSSESARSLFHSFVNASRNTSVA